MPKRLDTNLNRWGGGKSSVGTRFWQVFAAATSVLIVALTPGISPAATPESGVYSDKSRVGVGYFFEAQGDRYSFLIIADSGDGDSALYIHAGNISAGLAGDLYRVLGGHRIEFDGLDFAGQGVTTTRVGSVALSSAAGLAQIQMTLTLDAFPAQEFTRVLTRTNFGYHTIRDSRGVTCWPDLRGDWVFADPASPSSTPYRFRFSTLVSNVTAQTSCNPTSEPHVVSFTDPDANATLRCFGSNGLPDPIDGRAKTSGCELRVGASPTVVFSIEQSNLGLQRLVATPGPLPLIGIPAPAPTKNILGIRLER